MSGSLNKVTLIGNLGSDPEVRMTNSGSKVVNISVATTESWRDKQTGERKDKTEWHRVVIFNPGLCDVAEKYLKKGSKVYLEGALQTRKWQDNNGQDKYSTEIVMQGFNSNLLMLDKKDGESSGSNWGADTGSFSTSSASSNGWDSSPSASNNASAVEIDDDIPF